MMQPSIIHSGFRPELGMLFLVHGLAAAAAALGAFLLVVWAIKYLPAQKLKQLGLWFFGAGVVVCIVTLALLTFAGHNRGEWGMMDRGGFGDRRGMMGWDKNDETGEYQQDAQKEEATGKDLWTKLQKKQVTCASLKDDDFDTLGEYLMGDMMGSAHQGMNTMMRSAMGDDGEKAMHIAMGKRLSGCDAKAKMP